MKIIKELISKMRRKNKQSDEITTIEWNGDLSGIEVDMSITVMNMEKKMGYFIPVGDNLPSFNEYIKTFDIGLNFKSDLSIELEQPLTVMVECQNLETGDYESPKTRFFSFDGEESDCYMSLYECDGVRNNVEHIKVSFLYENSLLASQCFEIGVDNSIEECEDFIPVLEITAAEPC